MANVVTATGDAVAAGRMKGATPTQAEPLVFNWGNNPNALTAAKTDVGMFKEAAEPRVTGTSSLVTTTTTGDTYQVVATQTSAGTQSIGEFALYDSSTKPFSTTVTGGTAVGSAVGTTLTVAASYTPANNTYIQIRSEVLQVTAGTGTTSLTVSRGQNGSTATATIANSDVVTAGNVPGSSTITGGTIFVKGDMSVLNLNLNDSLTETVKVAFA